ncbi:GvpL/GvpF family gas vesicle protein [Streptomyces sp. V3I7]|uniref:GvpL/GvpF family gas vesicle protein n=1 Tax=Streptomyces sp. V3I7 TaxID=3042278 RepID=UPI0027875E64|nr:GvpL/GvpF family gas vesicle protein [Streptomyces sp. V3I7]MDQ0994352.1 hypothetical protein [Streptomyces sp. V3I7]
MAVYVYSIVGEDHPVRLDAVRGPGAPPLGRLRTIKTGALCAIVGDAPLDPRPAARNLAAYREVQQHLLAGGTVLPLRFGFRAADDAEVRVVLERDCETYARKLRSVAGCAEYRLEVAQDEVAAGLEHAPHRALATGVVEAFRPFTRERNPLEATGDRILSVAFLVPYDQEELFLATELSLAHQMGDDVRFRLEGPMPPYDFV